MSLNKRKANTGGVRESQQRRKMVGVLAKNSERYPRTTKLLVAEFKLRRAKGSKISKPWITSNIMKKIEMCYGKEEAEKFKVSDNWFQRFKRRNNISLKRRTNQKQHSTDAARENIQKFHLRKAVQSKGGGAMLFQTGNMDDGCQNKGSMLTKSLFLLLLNRTGHMNCQEANRSGFLNQALVLIKDQQLYNSA